MRYFVKKKKIEELKAVFRQNPLLIPLGCAAGFVNGFLGTGGGIILMFGALLMNKKGKQDTRDLFAETAIVTLVFSVVSAVIYFIKGTVPLSDSFKYYIPALVGGGIGALLLDKLPTKLLKKIFAAVVIVAGGIMLFR